MTSTTVDSSLDSRELRNALGKFATGVTVITTKGRNGAPVGVTANSFASVSLDPPMVLWMPGIHLKSLSSFIQAPHFAVNVLCSDQEHLSRQFASSGDNKFQGVGFSTGIGGSPVIDGALATFETTTAAIHKAGDHYIMIGEVKNYSYHDVEPLVFHGGGYRDLVAG